MIVGLCYSKPTVRAHYLLECFAEGVKVHGDETLLIDDAASCDQFVKRADVCVQVCTANKFHDKNDPVFIFRNAVDAAVKRHNKRLVIIDTGFIWNQTQLEIRQDSKSGKHQPIFALDDRATYDAVLETVYYEVGFDGLKRHADYCNANSPDDRWQKLHLTMKNWRRDGEGDHVLLVGQSLRGASSQDVDIFQWLRWTVQRMLMAGPQHFVYRMHPRCFKRPERKPKERDRIREAFDGLCNYEISDRWRLEDDLKHAKAAVVYSSNAAVTSVIRGVPTFVGSEGCMAWEVANTDFSRIDQPILPNRGQWAWNLAYAQWNCGEMKRGECWAHLRPHAIRRPA